MPIKVLTTDGTLQVFQARDLNSGVIAQLPIGLELQLGEATVCNGREWIEATLDDGTIGYVLAPSARGHTTFGAMQTKPALTAVEKTLMEMVAEQHAPPLDISILADAGPRRYCCETAKETLEQLEADVNAGTISKTAKLVVKTKSPGPKGKLTEWQGTLEGFAKSRPGLAALYWPIRHYSLAGLKIGAMLGCAVWLLLDGVTILQINQPFGLMFIAVPILWAIMAVAAESNAPVGFQRLLGTASFLLTGNLLLNGLYPMVFGAALGGALMLSFPGMALGGILAAVRRPKLRMAHDAEKEAVGWRIAIPGAIAIAVWSVYIRFITSEAGADLVSGLPKYLERLSHLTR